MVMFIFSLSLCCFLSGSAIFFAMIGQEHRALTREIIRLHIVADSDEAYAQALKLQVRDRVNRYLAQELSGAETRQEAEHRLRTKLENIRTEAKAALRQAGCGDDLQVELKTEKFHRRDYDTFSLPAGTYEALRITIGQGRGHNWWCVVFPALCIPASRRDFGDCAVQAGLTEETVKTLEQEDGYYGLRFGILDVWGEVKNLFS